MSGRRYCIIGFLFALFCSSSVWAMTFEEFQQLAAKDPNIHGKITYTKKAARWCIEEKAGDVYAAQDSPDDYFTKGEYIFDGSAKRFKVTITDLRDANSSCVIFGNGVWCAQINPKYEPNCISFDKCGGRGIVPDIVWLKGAGVLQIESVDLEYSPDPDELKPYVPKGTTIESFFADDTGQPCSVFTKMRQDKLMDIDDIIALAEEAKELYIKQGGAKDIEDRLNASQ